MLRHKRKQALLSRLLLVQTGKESQLGYIALLRPFLYEMKERRLKYFRLIVYYVIHVLYSLLHTLYSLFIFYITYFIRYFK